MIKVNEKEYIKNNIAINEITVKFLFITIYKLVRSTTNANIIDASATKEDEKLIKIKGFDYESKNKSESIGTRVPSNNK